MTSLFQPLLQTAILSLELGNARNVTLSMVNGKDIYRSPINGDIYSFSGYGGVMNCTDCDDFTQVNEYDRQEDGSVVWLCSSCENKHHL
jgi:hypothetical protein